MRGGKYSLDKNGSDGLARTAPGGKAVKHDELVLLDGILELLGAAGIIGVSICSSEDAQKRPLPERALRSGGAASGRAGARGGAVCRPTSSGCGQSFWAMWCGTDEVLIVVIVL